MTYIRPNFRHPDLPTNELGYTKRFYEGALSTLCSGCGHDAISGAIIQACFELSLPPHNVAKISGIGCSSKTPRSEDHTSELQSRGHLVCRLLLAKKNTTTTTA